MKSRTSPYLVQLGLLAAAYFAAGQLGYALTTPHPGLRLVWPATGIALAALVRFGIRLWPAVAVASFLLTVTGNGSPALAAGIALGNTLQAVIGAALLRRIGDFRTDLARLADVLQFVGLAALLSTAIGTTIGVFTFCLADRFAYDNFLHEWLPWWLQNVMSDLIVAPLLLTWSTPAVRPWRFRKFLIGSLLLTALVLACLLVFSRPFRLAKVAYPLTYALFPFLIGAALAFGGRGAATASFAVAAVAAGAMHRQASLNEAVFHEALVMQQAFLGVMAVTASALAAAVAERRQVEEALRQSVERYRRLFEGNPHPMLVFNTSTLRFLAVNDAAVNHYGYTRDEFLGMTILEIRPPEDVPRVREHLASGLPRVVRGGRWRHRKKNGTIINVQTDSHELEFGGQPARVVLVTDITERLRAEEAIRASEAKYRSLVENLEQSVFLKDAQFAFVAVNQNFCANFGRSPAEIVGRTDYDFFPRRLADKYRADDRKVLEEGHRLEVEEQALIGGHLRTVRTVKTPVKDGRGGSVGVLGIFWDVTEQRSLEAQLRQAQKMEAVGLLAGGVAHDFNNLLTVILGNVALLQARGLSPDTGRQMLQEVERAARRAAELTRQLLGFSRRTVLRPQPLCLADAAEQTAVMLRRTIDPRIAVEVEADAKPWTVEADPGQVDQVLMNLCINARDAMPEGGTLRVETANVVLDEAFADRHLEARAGEFVRLRVSDTGEGIPADVRGRIFEPFFTTKEMGKGTGLGLAVVFGIVKQHQGWIECASEPGRGTRFDVYLPRARSEAPVPRHTPTPATHERGTGTILLVDDEAMIRNLGGHVLRHQGYQVILADGGPEALAIYERERAHIDLVILDLTMPELSGRDTLARLRQIDPGVRVLFSSGYSAEQVTESENDGLLGFLSKPYSPKDLTAKVRAALAHTPVPVMNDDGPRAERLPEPN